MTMTVKLDPEMEREIRRRSAALGVPASSVIREALGAWLAANPEPECSAHELGSDLFGRYEGPTDLAQRRKESYVAAERRARGGC